MNKYLSQLTWLRGGAALLVVCSHSIRAIEPVYKNEPALSNENLFRIFDLGSFGVLLFFVLSGCTLTISNGLEFSSIKHVKGFFTKRLFRIWPAFLFAMIAYAAFRIIFQKYYHYNGGFWIERQFLEPVSYLDFFTYLSLTFNYTGRYGLFNSAFWSLPVEFQYYLIFPLLIFSLRFMGMLGPILIGGILYLIGRVIDFPPGIDVKFYLLGYSFCGGVLLGFIYLKMENSFKISSNIALFLVALIFLLNGVVYNHYVEIPDIIFISNIWNFEALSAFAITFVLLFSQIRLPQYLDNIFTLLGEVSYSSYLIHSLVIGFIMILIINLDLLSYEKIIVPVFAFAITYLLAIYMYKYIEKPGIRYGHKIYNKILSQ